MLPPPTSSFTIPSIQEDVILDCRVYHPASLAPTSISHLAEWNKKAAVVAHPYAPMGGSMDDPVVRCIVRLLLKQNFVVGTFNFRGAGTSKGRTSWQAKSEQKDYISFVAFVVFYMHLLSPQPIPSSLPKFTRSNPELHELSPVQSQAHLSPTSSADLPPFTLENEDLATINTQPRLLLAGYSYGALITSLLPPMISSIISPFQTPAPGSAYAEIRLRAESLAAQQTLEINCQISALLQTYTHRRGRSLNADEILYSKGRRPSGVRMGGGEDLRRASHDSFRSRGSFSIDAPELVRKSVDRVRSIGKHKRMSPKRHNTHDSITSSINSPPGSRHSLATSLADEKAGIDDELQLQAIPGAVDGLQMGYLLVSPLQGLVNSLATLWTSKCWREKDSISEHEMKFTVDPTLAIFGDDDVFVSVRRLRAWSEKLRDTGREGGEGRFRHIEVSGAGHFWHDRQAIRTLQDQIRSFVREL
ncbi:prolyl oligopeptidase-like protein [Rhexocercosporidium sp. MPI-PUGE-AT-0058]|nr:prolyl oligopeptidase-like protein [Rhexocercosporidium sp. MPI-PUGE-AT-0058]